MNLNLFFLFVIVFFLASCNSIKKVEQHNGIFYAKASDSIYHKNLKQKFQIIGDKISRNLTKNFKLPSNNIRISFKDCKKVSAYYIKKNSEIIMCYEMYLYLLKKYKNNVTYIYDFVLAHELSHALIDQRNIPIIGKIEDAADAISTVLLINKPTLKGRNLGVDTVLLASTFFADNFNPKHISWSGAHSIGPQRAANLVCWAIGSDPLSLVRNRARLVKYIQMRLKGRNCIAEYKKISKSTSVLLREYIK